MPIRVDLLFIAPLGNYGDSLLYSWNSADKMFVQTESSTRLVLVQKVMSSFACRLMQTLCNLELNEYEKF